MICGHTSSENGSGLAEIPQLEVQESTSLLDNTAIPLRDTELPWFWTILATTFISLEALIHPETWMICGPLISSITNSLLDNGNGSLEPAPSTLLVC